MTLNILFEKASAPSFSYLQNKSQLEIVSEEIERLKNDPALNGKVKYTRTAHRDGKVVFKVRLGLRKLGQIEVYTVGGQMMWWTGHAGMRNFDFFSGNPAERAVKLLADLAYKRENVAMPACKDSAPENNQLDPAQPAATAKVSAKRKRLTLN